jgi:hypothetical protein
LKSTQLDAEPPSMMSPSHNDLTAFVAVATHRSFRRAADELGMAPSTLGVFFCLYAPQDASAEATGHGNVVAE